MQDFKNLIPIKPIHLTFVLIIWMRFGFCMFTNHYQIALWFLHRGNVKKLSWEITQESLEIEFFEIRLNHGKILKR